MKSNGPKTKESKNNYISWLRFVNDNFSIIDETLSREKIENLCTKIKETKHQRQIYRTNNDVSNIKSALNKYCLFNDSNPAYSQTTCDLSKITNHEINTSQKSEIETRIGHGKYRKELIKLWGMCSVTKYLRIDFLLASHIKPWKDSSNVERIDPYNGLLLIPNIDKLFGSGYTTFDDEGKIIISTLLANVDKISMGVSDEMKLYKVFERLKPYLCYHRKNIFLK